MLLVLHHSNYVRLIEKLIYVNYFSTQTTYYNVPTYMLLIMNTPHNLWTNLIYNVGFISECII